MVMGSNMPMSRNLRKSHLGGVIFGCKNNTMRECLQNQLFGLPALHFSYVNNIEPGLPLFLFNYSDRKLHGIFEAASAGKMNINPYGWTVNGSERTQYPAQVQIRIRLQCRPLTEDQFKPIIGDNYYNPNHFWFELDHAQTNKLISKLSSLAFSPSTHQPYYGERQKPLIRPAPVRDMNEVTNVKKQLVPDADITSSDHSNSCGSSDVVPSNGDSKLQKDDSIIQSVEAEKDLIFTKLKELALNRGLLNLYLSDSVGDTSLYDGSDSTREDMLDEQNILEIKNEPLPLIPSDTQIAPPSDVQPALPIDAQPASTSDAQPAASSDIHSSIISSVNQPTISQLMEEIKELNKFRAEQTRELAHLWHRLVDAEAEIHRLKDNYLLESKTKSDYSLPISGAVGPVPFDKLFYSSEVIYLLGGHDGESWLSTLDVYSPSVDAKKSLSPMSCPRAYASVTKLNGQIYTLGGAVGTDWCNIVESYNVTADQWTPHASLSSKRGSLAAVTVGDRIYAVGGGNGDESLSAVEMLDPDVGRWICIRSMLQKRFGPAAVEFNNVIYITGGFDGKGYLSSVERFDPREHSWTTVQSMNMKRGCHSMAVLNEKLYVLGGCDGEKILTSVEVYDPRLGTWTVADPMNQERGYASAVVVGGGINMIGGIETEEKILDIVERYEVGKGWEVLNLKAIGKRSFGSAIVI